MDVQELEQQLDEALKDYKRKIKDTCDLIENEECKQAVKNLSEDVGLLPYGF